MVYNIVQTQQFLNELEKKIFIIVSGGSISL